MRSDTFGALLHAFQLSGNVADEEAVENAVSSAGAIAGNSGHGLTRATSEPTAATPRTIDRKASHHASAEQDRPGGIEARHRDHLRNEREHADRREHHHELGHAHHDPKHALPETHHRLPDGGSMRARKNRTAR